MTEFDPACRRCPRLARFLDEGRARHPEYHCAPVAPFGDAAPEAADRRPGARVSTAPMRPGGRSRAIIAGVLLYETLHAFGWASAPASVSRDDGLELRGCRITNAVKCVPPANKPTPAEIATCNDFLRAELDALDPGTVVLALGAIAHAAVLRARGLRVAAYRFGHAAEHRLPDGRQLIDSYHCSRYNTQTRRLTPEMFRAVVGRASGLAKQPSDATNRLS